MTQARPIICLERACLRRPGGRVVLNDLTWTIHQNETWAIVGPIASGKTTLAEALIGRVRVHPGVIRWPLLERLRDRDDCAGPGDAIAPLSFQEACHEFSYTRHYYQQRFNFVEPHEDLTLDAFLSADNPAPPDGLQTITQRLQIDHLRTLSLLKLSNGQMRRARLARALLRRPELLIIDEPFLGLDDAGRQGVSQLLQNVRDAGVRLLLITRAETVPPWVTHILNLDRADNFRPPRPTLPKATRFTGARVGGPLIEVRDANISYGPQHILEHVSWTVKAGERWALLGPNGSGKTTLLSLLYADHPQAYANEVKLFGRLRGPGESIWDAKRRIGFLSPEFHLYFHEPLSALDTVISGFFDVLVCRSASAEQRHAAQELLEQLGIAELQDRLFLQLSTGEQRLVLLARALVKQSPLVLLDEPFQGLDGGTMARVRDWLDGWLHKEQALVFVTHDPSELPASVNRRLRLDDGRVVEVT